MGACLMVCVSIRLEVLPYIDGSVFKPLVWYLFVCCCSGREPAAAVPHVICSELVLVLGHGLITSLGLADHQPAAWQLEQLGVLHWGLLRLAGRCG